MKWKLRCLGNKQAREVEERRGFSPHPHPRGQKSDKKGFKLGGKFFCSLSLLESHLQVA